MPKPTISGRRAAPTSTTSDVLLGGSFQLPVTLDPGEYELTVVGARTVVSKAGATVALINLATPEGETVNVRPILIKSQGGDSDMTRRGRYLASGLLGVGEGEQVSFADAVARLKSGRTVGVELGDGVGREGTIVNTVLDVWELED